MNKFDDLERLYQLKESKTITDEEFENEKNKILNDTSNITESEDPTNVISNEKVNQKLKPWQIILIIILTIIARNCSNLFRNYTY